MRPSIWKVALSIFLKYVVFFFGLNLSRKTYNFFDISSLSNVRDFIYYAFVILFLPFLDIVIFSAPLYFSLTVKNKRLLIVSVLIVTLLQYILYEFLNSGNIFNAQGILLSILGLITLAVFFFKCIISAFKH